MEQTNDFHVNGLLPNEAASGFRKLDLESERWSRVEKRTAQLIARIQPNQASEELRHNIANYVKGLVMKCFPCQVFTSGSVPLKTYLPDGDIDLIVFCKNKDFKETWASEVKEILESEGNKEDAEFHVKVIEENSGEVKVVKCVVENIFVDISINQLGGLCALCFLEEVDNLIKHDHLFKRSIILIKAWCYYENKILDARKGFMTTYALNTLVLYIFLAFNNSLAGPLQVLYRFLEFFGKFHGNNFLVSPWGSSFIPQNPPKVTYDVYPERYNGGESSLGKLIYACISAYTVFPRDFDWERPFRLFHFNVVDPLYKNNNIGRSVSEGNASKIGEAFARGAEQLAKLLDCPEENIEAEVDQFFAKTCGRILKLDHSDAGLGETDRSENISTCSSGARQHELK